RSGKVDAAAPNAVGGEEAAKPPLEVVGFGRGRDLLVTDGDALPQLAQLRLEQLAPGRVERFVLTFAPPVGKARRDLAGEERTEQRVARIRRRRWQDREIM